MTDDVAGTIGQEQQETVTPGEDMLLCRPAPSRKVTRHNIALPETGFQSPQQRGGKDPTTYGGNECIVEQVGHGESIDKSGVKVGDRIAVQNVVSRIVVNCEQKLLIHAHDVLAKVENWTEETQS